jgi:PST family polysaccharide transporter
VLGPNWGQAAPIFRFLAPTILIYAMINPMWWLLVSLGLAGRSLRIALVLAPLVMASYFVGLPYGPTGVALAYSGVMTLWVIPHIVWCIHGTMISLRDIALAVSRPLFSAVVAATVAGGCVSYLLGSASHVTRLLVGMSILLLVYVIMLFYVMGQKGFYLDLASALRKKSIPGEGNSAA